jgi:hypothetical protein
MVRVAEEGKQLPAKCEVKLKRLHGDDSVDIPVYQDDVEIGRIHVDNIPPQAGEGSQIILTVTITQTIEMRGEVKVLLRAGGAVVSTLPVNIRFPPLTLPDLFELAARFEELESRREELKALTEDPNLHTELSGKGAKISRVLKKKFAEQEPDKQEIYRVLKDLDRLVNPPPVDMDPPRSRFQRFAQECHELLDARRPDPQLDSMRTVLNRLEQDGPDAYFTRNQRKWSAVNESMARLYQRLFKLAGDLPPTPLLKGYCMQEMYRLRRTLDQKREELVSLSNYPTKFKVRCDDIEKWIDVMERAIDQVDDDLEARQGLAKLQIVLRHRPPLLNRMRCIEHDV